MANQKNVADGWTKCAHEVFSTKLNKIAFQLKKKTNDEQDSQTRFLAPVTLTFTR